MAYTPCPACTIRWVGAITPPDCPICHGEARIHINDNAARVIGIERHPDWEARDHGRVPEGVYVHRGARVIATALWLGLAREAHQGRARGLSHVEVMGRLGACAEGFREANLTGPGGFLKSRCPGPRPGDDRLLAGLCAPHERPTPDRPPWGREPRLSAGGHPSALARVVDPVDENTTAPKRFLADKARWTHADAVEQAVRDLSHNWVTVVDPGHDMIGDAA